MADRSRPVLVVEDDAELRELMELTLDAVGYRVVTAGEGRQALAQVEREMPAAILLDMRMPGMNGWEFAQEFRTRYGHDAPIVVVTAATSAQQHAEEIKAEGYLDKPFEIEDLIRTLERMWGSSPAAPDAADVALAGTEETALVAASANGDKMAFTSLYDRYFDRIYRYLYYRVSQSVDAEDLTQQVFLQAWSGLARYRQLGRPFSAWLFTIAHNLVVNFYRSTRSSNRLSEGPLVGDLPERRLIGNPEQAVEARFESERVRSAILRLKPIYQQVILLRYLDHMDCNAISAIIGKSAANVRVMQYRALHQLRSIMEKDDF